MSTWPIRTSSCTSSSRRCCMTPLRSACRILGQSTRCSATNHPSTFACPCRSCRKQRGSSDRGRTNRRTHPPSTLCSRKPSWSWSTVRPRKTRSRCSTDCTWSDPSYKPAPGRCPPGPRCPGPRQRCPHRDQRQFPSRGPHQRRSQHRDLSPRLRRDPSRWHPRPRPPSQHLHCRHSMIQSRLRTRYPSRLRTRYSNQSQSQSHSKTRCSNQSQRNQRTSPIPIHSMSPSLNPWSHCLNPSRSPNSRRYSQRSLRKIRYSNQRQSPERPRSPQGRLRERPRTRRGTHTLKRRLNDSLSW